MAEVCYSKKSECLRWLLDNGWDISRSQFYSHCTDGLLRPRKSDGKYTLKSLKKYADLHVKRLDTGSTETSRETRLREKKLELALERERLDLAAAELNLLKRQGKSVPRDEVDLMVVGRAVAFMAHLNHTVQMSAPDWIELVGGDVSLAPQLVDTISRAIEQRMAVFAAPVDIEVLLEGNS